MKRAIVGYHADELGDWVAELASRHGQHVRHKPPFFLRPWVTMLGTELECVLCDGARGAPGGSVPREG